MGQGQRSKSARALPKTKAAQTMSWVTAGAIVAAAIVVVNTGVYFNRQRRLQKHGKPTMSVGSKQITGTGMVLYAFIVCALLAGLIVPVIAPSSTFANWISADYSLMVYWVWCTVVLIVLEVILSLCGFPAWKKREESKEKR